MANSHCSAWGASRMPRPIPPKPRHFPNRNAASWACREWFQLAHCEQLPVYAEANVVAAEAESVDSLRIVLIGRAWIVRQYPQKGLRWDAGI